METLFRKIHPARCTLNHTCTKKYNFNQNQQVLNTGLLILSIDEISWLCNRNNVNPSSVPLHLSNGQHTSQKYYHLQSINKNTKQNHKNTQTHITTNRNCSFYIWMTSICPNRETMWADLLPLDLSSCQHTNTHIRIALHSTALSYNATHQSSGYWACSENIN